MKSHDATRCMTQTPVEVWVRLVTSALKDSKTEFVWTSRQDCSVSPLAACSLACTYGLTTPNATPIEIHVNCLNSMGRFHLFSTIST